MFFAPGMENVFVPSEIADRINRLEDTLQDLCDLYLDGCNSVYSIYFYKISPPEPSSLQRSFTLQEGIQAFMSDVVGGGYLVPEETQAARIRSVGANPPTREDIIKAFSVQIVEVLQPLQSSVFSLTNEDYQMYEDLLKPSTMSVGKIALCIKNYWFILMGEWSD